MIIIWAGSLDSLFDSPDVIKVEDDYYGIIELYEHVTGEIDIEAYAYDELDIPEGLVKIEE